MPNVYIFVNTQRCMVWNDTCTWSEWLCNMMVQGRMLFVCDHIIYECCCFRWKNWAEKASFFLWSRFHLMNRVLGNCQMSSAPRSQQWYQDPFPMFLTFTHLQTFSLVIMRVFSTSIYIRHSIMWEVSDHVGRGTARFVNQIHNISSVIGRNAFCLHS